jgi:hypothetical protein
VLTYIPHDYISNPHLADSKLDLKGEANYGQIPCQSTHIDLLAHSRENITWAYGVVLVQISDVQGKTKIQFNTVCYLCRHRDLLAHGRNKLKLEGLEHNSFLTIMIK